MLRRDAASAPVFRDFVRVPAMSSPLWKVDSGGEKLKCIEVDGLAQTTSVQSPLWFGSFRTR